jgi:hypothetical protein
MYALQLEVQGSSNEQWRKQREFANSMEQK